MSHSANSAEPYRLSCILRCSRYLLLASAATFGECVSAQTLVGADQLSTVVAEYSALEFADSGKLLFVRTNSPLDGFRFINIATEAESVINAETSATNVGVVSFAGVEYVGYQVGTNLYLRPLSSDPLWQGERHLLFVGEPTEGWPVAPGDAKGFEGVVFPDLSTPGEENRPRFLFRERRNASPNTLELWSARGVINNDEFHLGAGHLTQVGPYWNIHLEAPLASKAKLTHHFLAQDPDGISPQVQLAVYARQSLLGGLNSTLVMHDLVVAKMPPANAAAASPQTGPVEPLEYMVGHHGGVAMAFGPGAKFTTEGPYFGVGQIVEMDATIPRENAHLSILPGLNRRARF